MKQTSSQLAAAILILVANSIFAAETIVPFQMPDRGICAHRGASSSHPENTLVAFREAILLGAQMIEFDVALTKDNQLVLMHDLTVDRTTDGTGSVSNLTLKEVKELDAGTWKDKKFKGERVPTLAETLEIMPENIWLNVHLKGGSQLAEKVAKAIVDADRQHQCFLACGKEAAVAAKAVSNDIQICNMDRQSNSKEYVDATIAAGSEFIQLFGGKVDPSFCEQLVEAETRINFCCANDAKQIEELFNAGVLFPLVDNLAEMLKVADSLGIERLTPVYRKTTSATRTTARFQRR